MNEKIIYLKNIIGQDEVETCLNELTVLVKADQPIFDEIISVFGRFARLQKEVRLGLASFDNPEMNRIRVSLLSVINNIKEIDLSEDSKEEKYKINSKFNKIVNTINPNFENDIKNLEGDWNVDNIISKNTILIITGVHFFPEILDRISAYLLQSIINEKGGYQDGKRAIVIGDMPFEYGKNISIGSEKFTLNDISIISIGGPSINSTTMDIINNKHKTISNLGVNIAYEQNETKVRVALWGNSAYKTMKSVENFINLKDEGIEWFLHQLWNK